MRNLRSIWKTLVLATVLVCALATTALAADAPTTLALNNEANTIITEAGTYIVTADGTIATSIVIGEVSGDITLIFEDVTMSVASGYAINASAYTNTLTITGALNVTGGSSAIHTDNGNIIISGEDTVVTATATGYGIYAGGDLSIAGSTVTATATSAFSSSDGIYAEKTLSIADGAEVTVAAVGGCAIRVKIGALTISNATVEAQGVLTAKNAGFAITGSTVTMTGFNGIYGKGDSTISDSTVIATGTGGNGIWMDSGTLTISGTDTIVLAKGALNAIKGSTLTLNDSLTPLAYDGEWYTQAVTWNSNQYELDSDSSTATNVLICANAGALAPIVVSPDESDPVTVDGLGDVALEQGVSVTLIVDETTASADGAGDIAAAAGEEATIDYLNITLTTTVGGTAIPNPATVLEICIPYDYTDKSDFVVYRYHDGVDTFTALEARATAPYTDGQFFADEANGKLYIYTNQFSTYAVGYTLAGAAVSGSSGSSAGSTQRPITITAAANGSVSLSDTSASMNTSVTITALADDGYTVGSVTVTYSSGREVAVTDNGDGTFTYLQPGAAVSISVNFVAVEDAETLFDDVDIDDWYYDAVDWAVDNGLTAGTTSTSFNPESITTRGQAMAFMWYLMGQPAVDCDNPFSDISADDYYYEAVLWAVEEGITVGTTDTTFSPDLDCTRAHIITFLWRLDGETLVDGECDFVDVSADDYFSNAVQWAVSEGITEGVTNTTFAPYNPCTRAQIITFLYRYLGM